jgi:hypothetical protein
MDEEQFRQFIGASARKKLPIELHLERAGQAYGAIPPLVTAGIHSSPALAEQIFAEAERLCLDAASSYNEARRELARMAEAGNESIVATVRRLQSGGR